MAGKLYGVGVGPGDKELITLKALRILRECDAVAVPKMKDGRGTAYGIAKEYIEEKEIIECNVIMSRDLKKLEDNYRNIADIIEKRLKNGDNIAFITLGDPTVYSSYMQINSIISERGYETEVIPAVTSFCAAAAKLNMPLCERNEPLAILPAACGNMREWLRLKGNKVIMKANRSISEIRDILKEEELADKSLTVECCGMENERIYGNIDDIKENASYFSVIIIKNKGEENG